jgi:hypothetical protein
MKLLASLLLLVTFIGCASAPTVQNKQVASLQLLQRLDEFQDLTIDLYNTKQIDEHRAGIYTRFILSSAKVIRTLPVGWESTVKASWLELKTTVPYDKAEVKVQLLYIVLDKLIGAL